ncbi:CoA ester lyase [Nocardioides sp. LS1]|nr:CoA ester lyase [Nocardioides sp. LS1]
MMFSTLSSEGGNRRGVTRVEDRLELRLPVGPAILFCPADRPDRYHKALASADTVIIDLEDAVAVDRKGMAREALATALPHLPVERTVVRINSPRTADGRADIDLLCKSNLRFVMVPKVECPEDISSLAPLSVIALCETARGVEAAPDIARLDDCVGMMWGGEDLTADIGGRRSRRSDGSYLPHVEYARSRVLIAAAAAGISAWDGVYLDIPDLVGLRAECDEAVAMGFAAKVAIHPTHADVIRQAYRPTPAQLAWARKLLAALEKSEFGVVSFEGQMVDGPVVAMARAIVASQPHQSLTS